MNKRRRKPRYIRILLAFVVVLGLAYWVLNLSIFNINKIEVTGNNLVREKDILASSEIVKDQSIVFINKKEISSKIKRIPLIKDVKIKRRPIKTLKLIVTERLPVAYIYDGSQYIMIDDQGVAFQMMDNIEPGLMAIKGYSDITNLKVGDSIYNSQSREDQLIKSVLDKGYYTIIKSIDLSDKVYMQLVSDIEVAFGSYDDVEYKLDVLNEMYKKILNDNQSDRASMILMEEGPDPILVYD